MAWNLYLIKNNFEKYEVEWDKLNQRLYNSHPMLNSLFVEPLLKNFSEGNTFLAIYTENDSYQNMLLIERKNFYSWASFLPSQTQIGLSLVSNTYALEQLTHFLGLHVLFFDLLCQDPDYSFQSNVNKITTLKHAQTLKVNLAGTFDDYWKQRSKNLKKNIKRYRNKINSSFKKVEFKIVSEKKQLLGAMYRYGILESLGWKAIKGTAIHPNNQQGLFYNTIINNFSDKKSTKIFELYFDDQLVASRISISNDIMLIILKTTYREEYKKYAPGKILLYEIIQNEFQSKQFKDIEFYTNATKEQLAWETSSRNILHYTFYKNNFIHNTLKFIKSRKFSF